TATTPQNRRKRNAPHPPLPAHRAPPKKHRPRLPPSPARPKENPPPSCPLAPSPPHLRHRLPPLSRNAVNAPNSPRLLASAKFSPLAVSASPHLPTNQRR